MILGIENIYRSRGFPLLLLYETPSWRAASAAEPWAMSPALPLTADYLYGCTMILAADIAVERV